jgi:hypothetical protein
VAVEDQAKAAAGPGNRPQHVETLFEQADPARDKAFSPEPLIDELGHLCLEGPGAVDISDFERKLNQLIAIDQANNIIRHRHGC